MKRLETIVRVGLALTGWSALTLQFWLMVHGSRHPLRSAGDYFSFFTIEINVFVAFVLITKPASLSLRGAAAAYIGMVGIIYVSLLRHLWNPTGWWKVADVTLHDIVPVVYVLYWTAFVEKGKLRFSAPARWLIFPLVYLAYSLARGAAIGWYPYPFIDAGKLGYLRVFVNAAGLIAFFLVLSWIVVGLDRWLGRLRGGTGSEVTALTR